jgi:hypothetical protein
MDSKNQGMPNPLAASSEILEEVDIQGDMLENGEEMTWLKWALWTASPFVIAAVTWVDPFMGAACLVLTALTASVAYSDTRHSQGQDS